MADFERLVAIIGRLGVAIQVSQEGMKANQEKTDANLKEIIAEMKVWREVMKDCQGPGRTEIRSGQEKLEATGLEANPTEKEVIAGGVEVPNEEAAVETTRALEDRYGDRRLAVRQSVYTTKRKYFKDYCISHYSLMSLLHIAHSPIYI
jgi:hypothetical protein